MSRYTPKRSIESLRQSWMTRDPNDPRLSHVGRELALAACDPKRFQKVVLKRMGAN